MPPSRVDNNFSRRDRAFCEEKIELHKGVVTRMLHSKAFQTPHPSQLQKYARLLELEQDLTTLGVVPTPTELPEAVRTALRLRGDPILKHML